jgi:hypothetical protein
VAWRSHHRLNAPGKNKYSVQRRSGLCRSTLFMSIGGALGGSDVEYSEEEGEEEGSQTVGSLSIELPTFCYVPFRSTIAGTWRTERRPSWRTGTRRSVTFCVQNENDFLIRKSF